MEKCTNFTLYDVMLNMTEDNYSLSRLISNALGKLLVTNKLEFACLISGSGLDFLRNVLKNKQK